MKKDSPLNDEKILEQTLEIAKEKYEKNVNEKLEDQTSQKRGFEKFPDVEEIDGENLGTSKENLNFDTFTNLCEGDVEHLEGFDYMDGDLGLDGISYAPLKKALYYYENALRQKTIYYEINHSTKIDNRLHLLTITSPGSGKTTIKNQIKRIMKNFEGTDGVIDVAGVSHPEQLVGKIKYKTQNKRKISEPVYGLMAYKGVINDEAQEMINERNEVYAKAQRIKRLAMDTYKENLMSKKLVDDKPDDVLNYYSPSCVSDFAHPEKLESAFFDTGSFRRYFAFNISSDEIVKLNAITNLSFDDGKERKKSWKEFLDEKYNGGDVFVNFDQETLKIISHYHKCLLFFLLNHKNVNAMRYGLLTKYSMRSLFCKNVLILSKIRKEQIPSLYTTLSACSDTILFILKSVETYNDLGNIGNTSSVWGGVNEQDAQALEFLLKQKALSKKTSHITIRRFQTVLGNFYGCKTTQSRSHHYRLKRHGFVDSAQMGKYDSRVWLKFIPKETKLDSKGYNPIDFWNNYFKGDSQKKAFLTSLKSYYTDDKDFEKGKGDGGVGVMGCVLIKYYICVEVHRNKNKNKYIYNNEGGKYRHPRHPEKKPQKLVVLSVKKEHEGDKTPKNPVAPLKKKQQSDRDTQYWLSKDTKDIQKCNEEEVLDYISNNKNINLSNLLQKFGPGVLKIKKEYKL